MSKVTAGQRLGDRNVCTWYSVSLDKNYLVRSKLLALELRGPTTAAELSENQT